MEQNVVLEMRDISKNFTGVRALSHVDFTLRKGEIHALMGENGAGKSTLIKVLTGVHEFESGTIHMAGNSNAIINHSPQEAQANGISTVYQEVNLCPNLTVAENLFIGREPRKMGMIDWKQMNERSGKLLESLDIHVPPTQMLDECSINESIQDTVVKGLRLIPSNVNLAGAEIELLGINDKEYILKTAVDYIRDDYDFIVIDCPPSLNMLTVNAMTTADTVLVPIQCEYYALEGLSQLIHTINLVQERLNPNLQMEGVVFTMYDVRTKLSNQVVENVKENLDTKIYETMIPRNIRLAEAPSYGIPINMYDSKSAGAESYRKLAKEIVGRKDL